MHARAPPQQRKRFGRPSPAWATTMRRAAAGFATGVRHGSPSNEKITTPSPHKGEERCSVPLLGWPVACALAPMCDEKTRIRMTTTLAGFGQARRVYTRAPLLFVFLPGERRPAVHRLVGLSLRGEVPCWLWCGSNDVPNDARREPSGTVGQVCVFVHVSVSELRLEYVSISQVPNNDR